MSYFGSKLRKQSENENKETWKKVMEFYQKEFLCDLKLTVGYESRSAHRIVLSSLCPKGPWAKPEVPSFSRSENELFELDVSDVFKTPEIFTAIIDYIYLGNIVLRTETVMQILEVASQLNLAELITLCSQFLLEHIRIRNVLSLWNLAHEMNLRQLAEVCRVLTRELLKDVLIDSNDMKLLSVDFMGMLLDQKYVMDTLKPTEIVRFILKWLVDETKERLQPARAFISTIEICQSELLKVCDSVCQNQEMEAATLQEMLRDCSTSLSSKEQHPQETTAIEDTPESNTETASIPERRAISTPNLRNNLDRNGCWVLMVRDYESTAVFCQKTQTWLKFPHITYPYVVGFSDRKFLACTRQPFARSFQIIDFTLLHQPGSIEERRLMDDIFPDPDYIWYLCNQYKWYLASLINLTDKYSLILHEWDDVNGVFIFRRNFQTSLPITWIIKDFTYFNEDGYSLVLLIVTPTNITYQNAKTHDLFYVFRVSWKETIHVEEVFKDTFYHRCFTMSKENFLYHDDLLYLFDQDIVKNLVGAIENNIPITLSAEVFDLTLKNDNIHKSIQLPQPGLNILPLKPKSQHASDAQGTQSPNAAAYDLDLGLDSFQSEPFSKKYSSMSVIDKKLFLVAHRAPGIVQTFIVDIFEKSWKLTPPLPLAGLSDIRINTFYSDCSLHEDFPVAKKSFESEDFPIFEKWCLQQCQGFTENAAQGSILSK